MNMLGERIKVRVYKDPNGYWVGDWDLFQLWIIRRYSASLGGTSREVVLGMADQSLHLYRTGILRIDKFKFWQWLHLEWIRFWRWLKKQI